MQAERLHRQLAKAGMKTKTEQAFRFKKMIERTFNGHFKKGADVRMKEEGVEVERG